MAAKSRYLSIIPRRGFGSLDRGTRTSLHTCVGAAVNLGSIIAAKYAVGASLNQITGPALSKSLPTTPHYFLMSLISDVPVELILRTFCRYMRQKLGTQM